MSGHTCAQIFTDGEGFFRIVPLFSKAEVGTEIRVFARQVGIPNELHFDRTAEKMVPNRNSNVISGNSVSNG